MSAACGQHPTMLHPCMGSPSPPHHWAYGQVCTHLLPLCVCTATPMHTCRGRHYHPTAHQLPAPTDHCPLGQRQEAEARRETRSVWLLLQPESGEWWLGGNPGNCRWTTFGLLVRQPWFKGCLLRFSLPQDYKFAMVIVACVTWKNNYYCKILQTQLVG